MQAEEVRMGCRVGIWGLGWHYWHSINTLLLMQHVGQIELVGATSAELPAADMLDGMPLMTPADLAASSPDVLVVMSDAHYGEIAEKACELGFAEESIVSCKVIEVPHVDLGMWARLRRNPPCIVSSNAWGAMAAQTLQLPSCSPLDEAAVSGEGFLRLVGDLPGHLARPLAFIGLRHGRDGRRHPWFALGDVELGFELRETREEAERIWEERIARFDARRAFAALTTHDRTVEQRFDELDGVARCCFVPYESACAHSLRVPIDGHGTWFSNSVVENAGRGPHAFAFDLVGLLSGANVKSCSRVAWNTEGIGA